MRRHLGALIVLLLAGTALVFAVVVSGWYNIGADDPHWGFTSRLIETLRNRSIERRAQAVTALPRLDEPQLILKGAGQYAAMCQGCHLAPGLPSNELHRGLYPRPPLLYQGRVDPRVAYVTIKHGIKMTGMPAWGGGHGDEAVWSLVAFVNQLPGMTPQQYQDIVRRAPPDEEMAPHGEGPGQTHSQAPMQMPMQKPMKAPAQAPAQPEAPMPSGHGTDSAAGKAGH